MLCCAPELCGLLVYPGRRAESRTSGHATLLRGRHSSDSVCLESLQALRGSTPSKSPSVICTEIACVLAGVSKGKLYNYRIRSPPPFPQISVWGPCATAIGTAACPPPANCCCTQVGQIESHAPPHRNTEPEIRVKWTEGCRVCACVWVHFHVCETHVIKNSLPKYKENVAILYFVKAESALSCQGCTILSTYFNNRKYLENFNLNLDLHQNTHSDSLAVCQISVLQVSAAPCFQKRQIRKTPGSLPENPFLIH